MERRHSPLLAFFSLLSSAAYADAIVHEGLGFGFSPPDGFFQVTPTPPGTLYAFQSTVASIDESPLMIAFTTLGGPIGREDATSIFESMGATTESVPWRSFELTLATQSVRVDGREKGVPVCPSPAEAGGNSNHRRLFRDTIERSEDHLTWCSCQRDRPFKLATTGRRALAFYNAYLLNMILPGLPMIFLTVLLFRLFHRPQSRAPVMLRPIICGILIYSLTFLFEMAVYFMTGEQKFGFGPQFGNYVLSYLTVSIPFYVFYFVLIRRQSSKANQ